VILLVLVGVAAAMVGTVLAEKTETNRLNPGPKRNRTAPHAVTSPRPSPRQVVELGDSVGGRPIGAVVLGAPRARSPVLIIGCVHGNETAGIAVATLLAQGPAPPGSAIWILSDLNPDGVAAGTRQNARAVDLNRNFPYRWQPLGARGDQQYSGPRPLSEPESRIAYTLILRLRPRITIWFHQPLGVTDSSGGDIRIDRRFAKLSGLPLTRLTRYPGSAVGWQNHRLPRTTAFVVELPPGPISRTHARRLAEDVRRLAVEPSSRARRTAGAGLARS
jgi:murein peptide amidase A